MPPPGCPQFFKSSTALVLGSAIVCKARGFHLHHNMVSKQPWPLLTRCHWHSSSCDSKNVSSGGYRDASAVKSTLALAEDQDSVPSTHIRQPTATFNSISRDSDALFWPSKAPAHMVYIQRNRHTHMHKSQNT